MIGILNNWWTEFAEKYIISDVEDLPKPRMVIKVNESGDNYYVCSCVVNGLLLKGAGLDMDTAYRNWLNDCEKIGY